MNLIDMIMNQNKGGVDQVAQQFNLPPNQARNALNELLGPLSQGLQRNMARPEGLDSLIGALRKGNHQQYIDRPDVLTQESTREDGNKILGHIFGSKEVSRQVAGEASQKTGIDVGILKKMLPVVATMVMGGMSKQAQSAPEAGGTGMLGNILTSFLGGGAPAPQRQQSAGGGLLGGLLGKLFGR